MSSSENQEPVALQSTGSELTGSKAQALLEGIPQWSIVDRHGINRLERTFTFASFAEALAFANKVGALAEEANHHPAILVQWGKASVSWWTHSVSGLHERDFAMAVRTDGLLRP